MFCIPIFGVPNPRFEFQSSSSIPISSPSRPTLSSDQYPIRPVTQFRSVVCPRQSLSRTPRGAGSLAVTSSHPGQPRGVSPLAARPSQWLWLSCTDASGLWLPDFFLIVYLIFFQNSKLVKLNWSKLKWKLNSNLSLMFWRSYKRELKMKLKLIRS